MSKPIMVGGYMVRSEAIQWVGPIEETMTDIGMEMFLWHFDVRVSGMTITLRSQPWLAGADEDIQRAETVERRNQVIAAMKSDHPLMGGYLGPQRKDKLAMWAETKDDVLNDAMHRAAMKSVAEGLPTRSVLGDTNPMPAAAVAPGYEPDDDPLPDPAWPEGDRTEDLMPSISWRDDLPEPTELW